MVSYYYLDFGQIILSINRWVDILYKRHTRSTKGQHVALYMGSERGFLGDERWYTRVGFGFKLYSCIGFSSHNKEQVSLRGRRFNGGADLR